MARSPSWLLFFFLSYSSFADESTFYVVSTFCPRKKLKKVEGNKNSQDWSIQSATRGKMTLEKDRNQKYQTARVCVVHHPLAIMCQTTDGIFSPTSPLLFSSYFYSTETTTSALLDSVCQSYTATLYVCNCAKEVAESEF